MSEHSHAPIPSTPIIYNEEPVVTTEMLAMFYGAGVKLLQQNFSRNKSRFIEGRHFIKLAGENLRGLSNLHFEGYKARHLLLWTKRGAARHAKMLSTNKAWDVFEELEDTYFAPEAKKSPIKSDRSHDTEMMQKIRHFPENMIPYCAASWSHLAPALEPYFSREITTIKTFLYCQLAKAKNLPLKERLKTISDLEQLSWDQRNQVLKGANHDRN